MIRLLNALLGRSRRHGPLEAATDLISIESRSFDRPVLVFKHSEACAYSATIRSVLVPFAASDGLDVCEIVVQRNRRLSASVEDRFGVFHQTPQALLIQNGRCTWSASQSAITADAISQALAGAHDPKPDPVVPSP